MLDKHQYVIDVHLSNWRQFIKSAAPALPDSTYHIDPAVFVGTPDEIPDDWKIPFDFHSSGDRERWMSMASGGVFWYFIAKRDHIIYALVYNNPPMSSEGKFSQKAKVISALVDAAHERYHKMVMDHV